MNCLIYGKNKVDAIAIGDWESDFSEQELVVLNPRILSSVGKSEQHQVYKLKSRRTYNR